MKNQIAKGYVSEGCFNESIRIANQYGIKKVKDLEINMSRVVLVEKVLEI